MKTIFILYDKITETRGHGDYGAVKKLATYNGYDETQYPAFKSIKDAEEYISNVSKYWKPQILELPIYETI